VKLATLRDGTRDGRLLVVRGDGETAAPSPSQWPSLQAALDDWSEAEGPLRGSWRMRKQKQAGDHGIDSETSAMLPCL